MPSVQLSITPWADREVQRTLEIATSSTLADLHAAILTAFDYEDDHAHAFFMNGQPWDAEFGVWSKPDKGQLGTAKTSLASLSLRPNKRFLYLFDFGDEHCFEVRVLRISESEAGSAKGSVIESVGKAPPQYPGEDEDDEDEDEDENAGRTPNPALASLVARVEPVVAHWERANGFDDFDDDDDDDDERDTNRAEELPEPVLTEEYALANELLERTGDDLERFDIDIEGATRHDVFSWLLDLPARLAEGSLLTEAIALSERVLRIEPDLELRASLPFYLARAERREPALAALERNLAEEPEDPLVLYQAGATCIELGEPARAEQHWRTALEFAGSMPLREDIVTALSKLLEVTGGDVAKLQQAEQARLKSLKSSGPLGIFAAQETVRRETPKVGRNDPCPCGSGKKFKKCCGA